MLFSQLQKRIIDSVYIKGLIKRFTSSIQAIRDSIPPDGSVQQPPTTKRRALGHEEHQRLAREDQLCAVELCGEELQAIWIITG
ncbi:hypothetical protein KUCAC02_016748 [Chaenocephalus aceratus]|nr:hypothetical protein KUCAC02_016748 [Chaenocephalus aceratus]